MEGIHQRTYLLTDVTKSIKRADNPKRSWEQQAESKVQRAFSRLVRWHHSLAVVANYTRGEQVMMMMLSALIMMMTIIVIIITDDYKSSSPYPVPVAEKMCKEYGHADWVGTLDTLVAPGPPPPGGCAAEAH